jgi:hypothetical protein
MAKSERSEAPPHVTAIAPLSPSQAGGSGSFLLLADDQRKYWCKTLNNNQGPRIPVTEQIVARLGARVGVAVCRVSLVYIPEDLVGWEFVRGQNPPKRLEEGYAHGSVLVEGVTETRTLADRERDENSVRHAGFFALYDWLVGDDPQWLVAGADESRYWSHDHGHYLTSPNWTQQTLAAALGAAHELAAEHRGLDVSELRRLADALRALESDSIPSLLRGIPLSWPVTDNELDAVVEFADQRRTPVAERLSRMADRLEGQA